jgi:hypothetical protein
MVKEVIVELAKANPELLETQNERFGLASKRPHNALGPASSVPDETPPLKLPKPHQPRSPFRTRLRNPQTLNIAVLNVSPAALNSLANTERRGRRFSSRRSTTHLLS